MGKNRKCHKCMGILFFIAFLIICGIFMFTRKKSNSNKLDYKINSIEKTIQKRRSIRKYKNISLTSQEIKKLLFAAQGITDKTRQLRAAPSAGALYPLEIYLVAGNVSDLSAGIYKYNPKKDGLEKILDGDKRKELYNAALSQDCVKDAAASIIICAIYERTTKKYGNRGRQYVHMEVGSVSENIYLQATALDLGTVFVGAFDDNFVAKILNIEKNEIPLCIMPIGKTNKETNMGKKAKEIIGIDSAEVVEMLSKAFADEWLAYYQYWLGAKLAVGPTKSAVIAELEEHAIDELRHAQMLSNRITQLGGTPPLSPQDWYNVANCQYATPSDPQVKTLLIQNIEGEQCAIDVYNKILQQTKDKDPITYNLALQILEDEVEHEEDLENLLDDLKTLNLK